VKVSTIVESKTPARKRRTRSKTVKHDPLIQAQLDGAAADIEFYRSNYWRYYWARPIGPVEALAYFRGYGARMPGVKRPALYGKVFCRRVERNGRLIIERRAWLCDRRDWLRTVGRFGRGDSGNDFFGRAMWFDVEDPPELKTPPYEGFVWLDPIDFTTWIEAMRAMR